MQQAGSGKLPKLPSLQIIHDTIIYLLRHTMNRYFSAGIFCILVFSIVIGSVAGERAIKKQAVPKAVLTAFHAAYPAAVVKGYAMEDDSGAVRYEIESTEGAIHRDITYSADGTAVSIEESIPYTSLPERVRNTITKSYPKGKVSVCEKVTKGSVTQFEILLTSGKKNIELILTADGSIQKTEKK